MLQILQRALKNIWLCFTPDDLPVATLYHNQRQRRRWIDLVREDMERVGAREGDEVDELKWRLLSRCGDPE